MISFTRGVLLVNVNPHFMRQDFHKLGIRKIVLFYNNSTRESYIKYPQLPYYDALNSFRKKLLC